MMDKEELQVFDKQVKKSYRKGVNDLSDKLLEKFEQSGNFEACSVIRDFKKKYNKKPS